METKQLEEITMETKQLVEVVKKYLRTQGKQDISDEDALKFIEEKIAINTSSYRDEMQVKLMVRKTQNHSSDRAMLSSPPKGWLQR